MTSPPSDAPGDRAAPAALLLRPARDDDVAALRTLLDSAWRTTYASILDPAQLDAMAGAVLRPDVLRARLFAANAVALVAEIDGAIVGHLAARLGANAAHVDRLYVADAAQGRGVGAALLGALQARLGARAALTLHVAASNGRALAFYLRQGFRETERTRETVAGVGFDVRVLRRAGAP